LEPKKKNSNKWSSLLTLPQHDALAPLLEDEDLLAVEPDVSQEEEDADLLPLVLVPPRGPRRREVPRARRPRWLTFLRKKLLRSSPPLDA
jgi:hypothetical protein